jgi:hypothetical protein
MKHMRSPQCEHECLSRFNQTFHQAVTLWCPNIDVTHLHTSEFMSPCLAEYQTQQQQVHAHQYKLYIACFPKTGSRLSVPEQREAIGDSYTM